MRWPNSGSCSNQFSFSRSFTTSPTIVSAGGEMFSFAANFAIVASVPAADFCFPSRAPLDDGDGRFRRHAVRDERFRPVVQIIRAHEHDLGAGDFGDLLVAQGRGRIRRIAVAGEHGEAGAMLAVREGNARVIRRGDDRRNARHDFEMDFRRRQRLGFFAAAAENERIAALEPDDAFAFARFGDAARGDFLLRHLHVVCRAKSTRRMAGEAEQVRVDERVVENHVGAAEQFRAAQRKQARVARSGPDKINVPLDFTRTV